MNLFVKRGALAFMLACLHPLSHAGAAADLPSAYTHTLELGVSGKESLVRLRLPKEVYQASRSARLDDLRLFDQEGKMMPFAFLDPAGETKESVVATPATVFPVMADAAASNHAALDIRTSADGTLVSVNVPRQDGAAASGSKLVALVIDTRGDATAAAAPAGITALRLSLPPNVDNYTARIALEVSDDLKHWENLGDSVVSWLTNSATKALASDRIEFDAQSFRYARLTWREGTPLLFSTVVAERRARANAARKLDSMVLTAQPGRVGKDLVFRVGHALPVQSFGLQFAADNVVVPVLVGRYIEVPVLKQGQAQRWDFEPAFRATFFRLSQGGKIRTSGDVAIAESHVGEWVVRPLGELAAAPTLRIAWQPASIVFLSGGKKPYTLAVGREGAAGAAADLSSVAPGFGAAELTALEQATTGTIRQQRVAAVGISDAAAAAASARGRTAALWGVLLIGVLALASMVRHLVKQMPA